MHARIGVWSGLALVVGLSMAAVWWGARAVSRESPRKEAEREPDAPLAGTEPESLASAPSLMAAQEPSSSSSQPSSPAAVRKDAPPAVDGTILCRIQSDDGWMPYFFLERDGRSVCVNLTKRGAGLRELGPLEPGVYTLRYRDPAGDLVTLEDIRVERGQQTRDPRLDPLDLRGRRPRPSSSATTRR